MTARDMHYDYKQKLNKIDSQKYRDLYVPEIDWKLNEAQELLVKIIAEPRLQRQLGFEVNQRTIDDIRTIVVNQKFADGVTPTVFDDSSYLVTLPVKYWFRVRIDVYGTKGNCSNVLLYDSKLSQHDDDTESEFNKSSFEWRVSNYRYIREGVRLFTDKTFSITKVCFAYLLQPRMIHNAQDYIGGTYNTPDGVALTGSQSSELPEGIHREIVDLAVFITAGNLNLSSYGIKQNTLKLHN